MVLRYCYICWLPGCLHCVIRDIYVNLLGCQKPLGMERHFITNAQITASSQWDINHAAIQARLQFKAGGGKQGAWSAGANNQNQWLKVDLLAETDIRVIATQGRNLADQWVTSYKLDYSNDDNSFQKYRDPGSSADKVCKQIFYVHPKLGLVYLTLSPLLCHPNFS